MRSRQLIAIDGPAGAGKSTVARRLAKRLGFRFLDTGALYRAVTLLGLRDGVEPANEDGMAACAARVEIELVPHPDAPRVLLHGEDVSAEIRGPAVTKAVSTVATLPSVRSAVVRIQRSFAAGDGGIVAEGRDIGTVVFPDADVKVYLDAHPSVRARRRADEDGEADLERVAREIGERDRRDLEREVAPLRKAEDALVIDTTDLDADAVVELLLEELNLA